MTKKKTKELSDEILLEAGENPRTIKMTFGLLNRLCRLVGDVEGAIQLLIEPNLQEAVILEVLAERNADGQITRKHDLEEYDFSKDEMMVLLEWVADHLLDFFLATLELAKRIQEKNKDLIESLQPPSESGSDGSQT